MKEKTQDPHKSVFNTTTDQFHMACLGLVVFQMKNVPGFPVNSLPPFIQHPCNLHARESRERRRKVG